MELARLQELLMELKAQAQQLGLDFAGDSPRSRRRKRRPKLRSVPMPVDPLPLDPEPQAPIPRQPLADARLPASNPAAHSGKLLGRCVDCERKLAKTAGKGTKWCPKCNKKHQVSIPVDLGKSERKAKKRTRCPTCGGVKRATDRQCQKCFRARFTRFAQIEARLLHVRALLEEMGILSESSGANALVFKAKNGKWYLELEEEGHPVQYYGPFSSEDQVIDYVDMEFQNPGGFSFDRRGKAKPPKRPSK